MSPEDLSGVEDVSIFLHNKRSPLAQPEDLEDELLPRTMENLKLATLTRPDEDIREKEVKCYRVPDMFLSINKHVYHI